MRALYKIIHTCSGNHWTGIEKRILTESVWMADRGHQVIILAPEESPLFSRAKGFGFRLYPVPFKRLTTFADHRRLMDIIQNERPHILNTHLHADSRIALPAAAKSRVSCRILSKHTSEGTRRSWQNRRLYKKLNHYIFTSAGHTRNHLKQVFKLKDMEIFSIPPGIVPPQGLPPRDEARKTLAQKLNLEPSVRFWGLRVFDQRDLAPLLNTFGKIKAPDHHLIVMGAAPSQNLVEISKPLGLGDRIHFMDPGTRKAPGIFRGLDATIFHLSNPGNIPFEDLFQALFQAMHVSCPVIGSKQPGLTDIIEHQKNGLLYEPQDHGQLSEMLYKTLDNEPALLEMTHGARQKAKKDHTVDAMGRDLIRIYRLHQVRLEKRMRP